MVLEKMPQHSFVNVPSLIQSFRHKQSVEHQLNTIIQIFILINLWMSPEVFLVSVSKQETSGSQELTEDF